MTIKATAAKKSATAKKAVAKKDPVIHIVRGRDGGVVFGTIAKRDGTEVTVSNCRRIWSWEGALDLVDMAARGIAAGKLSAVAPEVLVLDAILLLRCTREAVASFDAVAPWRRP